jgi:hypothetical protein
MKDANKHYITIFMMGECVPPPTFLGLTVMQTKPQNLEPHKCAGWESYSWDELCRLAENKEDGEDNGDSVQLFGPLLQLVKEAPQTVIDFMNNA